MTISDTELEILLGSYEPSLHAKKAADAPLRVKLVHLALLELKDLRVTVGAKQAKIDMLMLEFCPDEMTPEQKEEWGRHQRPVSEDVFSD